jgi:hypothetical protein
VLPQQDGEMLASVLSKTPANPYALRHDVTVTPPADTPSAVTSQHLVTQSSDPFLGRLGGEDTSQQHTSPEHTEDDEVPGEKDTESFRYMF